MNATLSPIFTWRTAIAKSGLPPTVRHVALTLSLYMNERGGSAWPSLSTLAEDSGLSTRTIMRGIRGLEKNGYLRCERRPGASTLYTGIVPTQLTLGDSLTSVTVSPPTQWHPTPDTESPTRDTQSPNQANTTTSITPRTRTNVQSGFDAFWVTYPKRKGKGAARKAWGLAVKKAPADVILAGARRYFEDPNLPEPDYIPLPATWLNQERWEDDPEAPHTNGQSQHPYDRTYRRFRELTDGR